MKPVILITRPQDDAAETAVWVETLGFRPVCAPVLDIKTMNVTLPDAEKCQGLIFSSANGVRAFSALSPAPAFLRKPVFAVGDHTANVAQAAGFTDVRSAAGAMKDLVALIRRQMVAPARLIHLRGRDVRDNPAIMLPQSEGWVINGITLYAADPVQGLNAEALEAIANRQVEAVLFYSARSAKAFTDAAIALNLKGAKALCLADSVVQSLKQDQWADIRVAAHPDRSGMMKLVEAITAPVKPETAKPEAVSMQMNSNTNDDANALNDAETVIERFGGIRPMATKMNVPVTTVQGWKKRNVIPGNRRDDVLSAAVRHNIDLSDVVANENDFSSTLKVARREEAVNPSIDRVHQQAITGSVPEAETIPGVTKEDMMKEIRKSQLAAVRKSVMASAGLILVFAMFAGLTVAIGQHQIEKTEERVALLEQQAPAATGGPTPFAKMMDSMQGHLNSVEASVAGLKTQVEAAAGPLATGSITQRLGVLEQTIQGLTGANPDLGSLAGKLQNPQMMEGAGNELKGLVTQLQGRMDGMDAALAEQQKSNTALGQALEGVSPKELKAAALLIGLNQFRDSLDRREPFADDLAMLQRMTGDQDPELNAAINKLAPYAEKGVLSSSGLSAELKGLTGDIVVSSVKGENVSVQDKAMARFQKFVTVEKDGKPVMGNESQATVAKAQALLDAGDVDGAMAQLQSLKGPARTTAQPIIDQGQVTLMAQQVQSMLSRTIISQLKGAGGSAPLTAKPSIIPMTAPMLAPPVVTPQAAPTATAPATPPVAEPAVPPPSMGSFKALNNQPVQTP